MKSLLVLSVLTAITSAELYDNKFDGVNIDAIISDPASMKKLTMCFLNRGECNEMGAFFKVLLPEITLEACASCTNIQKHSVRLYFDEMDKNFSEDFEELKKKFDPEGKYFDKLQAAISNA